MSEDKPDLSTKTNASESTDKPKVVEEQEVVVRVIKPEHETLLQDNGENNEVYNNPTVEILPADGGEPEMARSPLRLYRQRWLVLAVVALLNNLNCVAWIAYSPIFDRVNNFYHFSEATNWFSAVYIIVTVPVGIFAMWTGSKFGLRVTILIAAWSNAIGLAIRLLSSFLPSNYMFPVGITGQAIAGIAYPFIMFLPTKVAAAWFASNERAKATTIGVMSNPLGVLLANLLAPILVQEPNHVLYLNILIAVPAILLCLIATATIRHSAPKTPPTLSAAQEQMKFVDGIKTCFTSKPYIILLIVMGGGIGMFNCLYMLLQQLLCPYGYKTAGGYCAIVMIIGGLIGATASGIFVDRTRRYTETMKVSMAAAVIFGLIFLQLTMISNIMYFILVCGFLFGVMGLAMYPVGLEMSAECTFPVTETTSTGFVVLSGQIQGFIFLMIMNYFAKPLSKEQAKIQVCDPKDPSMAKDMRNSIYIVSAIALSMAIALVVLFKPIYKRMNAEKGAPLIDNEGGKLIAMEPAITQTTETQPNA